MLAFKEFDWRYVFFYVRPFTLSTVKESIAIRCLRKNIIYFSFRRKVDERHQRRDNLDQHKHGDCYSGSYSYCFMLHLEGEMYETAVVQRAIMTIQAGVRQACARGLPHRVSPLQRISAIFTRWQRVLLQLPSILIRQE